MLNFFELERHIVSQMQAHQVPGLALALVEGEKIIYARGFGVTSVEDGGVPVTPQTLFRIGSITKPMTGTLIMRLAEEGKLDLDALAKDYVPGLTFSQSGAADQITLGMLLSHTAGLPTSHEPFGRRDPAGLGDYIREQMPRYQMIAPPSKVYSYSNPGIRLLGYIAELVCDTPYTQLMQKHIFDPLDMRHSTFDPTVAMTYALAHSHDLNDDGTLSVQHRFGDNRAGYPSGAVISNVLDLANFAMMLIHEGRFQNQQIISPASIRQMQTIHGDMMTVSGSGYGLTLIIDNGQGVRRVGHTGAVGTYGSILIVLPESHRAVIITCNRAFGFWDALDQIVDGIITEWLDLPATQPTLLAIQPEKSHWPSYAGHYVGQLRGLIKIYTEDDRLILDWQGEKLPLEALRQDLYFGKSGEAMVSVGFVDEATGPTQYVMLNGAPCKRMDDDLPVLKDLNVWQKFTGVFVGVDKLKITLQGDTLHVYSDEMAMDYACIVLSETAFACKMGLIEFEVAGDGAVTGLLLQGAYRLKRRS
ncbi:MAG: beta-lactamase family protein [Chloroflexi bacterium]|nr:beta-lactamase family protein [Chloroflexota bacterium]